MQRRKKWSKEIMYNLTWSSRLKIVTGFHIEMFHETQKDFTAEAQELILHLLIYTLWLVFAESLS
jgi:hypothetical protein